MIISVKTLRRMIGILAMLFPFMLILGGLLSGTGIQRSLSAYYWTTAGVLFSGFIMHFGIILSVYNGYDKADRIITATAAAMMFAVALFPCLDRDFYLFEFIPAKATAAIHYTAAGIGFSLMGVMSVYQFHEGGQRQPREGSAEPSLQGLRLRHLRRDFHRFDTQHHSGR